MELENGKKINIDVVQWVKDHQKQILQCLGVVCLAKFCYKRGYKKGEKDMTDIVDCFIAITAAGGERWTK